jgi:hypothetical protein
MATTSKGLRYPVAGDNPAVHTDIQNLASDVDTLLDTYIGQTNLVSITFEGSTPDGNETTLTVTDPTADRTVTIPDATGTIVLDSTTQTLTGNTTLDRRNVFTPQVTGLEIGFSQSIVFEGTTPDASEQNYLVGLENATADADSYFT